MSDSLARRDHASLLATYRRLEPEFVHGEGAWLVDREGQQTLDLVGGLAVNVLGYGDPELLAAIQTQSARYVHLSNAFVQEPQVELAEALCAATGLRGVFFSNSGAESFEAAMKVIRRWGHARGKSQVFGFSGGFHGRTYAPLSVMGQEKYRAGFGPFLDQCSVLPFNDPDALEHVVGPNTAAVVLEIIQGEGGIVPAREDFLDRLQALRQHFGFLLVVDEVQTGVGRTGSFLAVQQTRLQPDLVLLAKGIGGGLPLGAVLVGEELREVLSTGSHGTTCGGNPVACAAGQVVLRRVAASLAQNAMARGKEFLDGMHTLKHTRPDLVAEVRGRGLMLGLVLRDDAEWFRRACLEHRILVNITAGSVVRLLPPLVISSDEVHLALTVFRSVLTSRSS